MTRRLVLVAHDNAVPVDDLQRVAGYIRERTRDVVPVVVRDRRLHHMHPALLLGRPWVVSFLPLRQLRPSRGVVYQGLRCDKIDEYRRLEPAGIAVPEWRVMRRDQVPDATELGEYVIVKPARAGRGADVTIRKASRLRYKPPTTALATSVNRNDPNPPFVVQRFVYTGRWPVSYRVATLFGRALFAVRIEANHGHPPLDRVEQLGSGPGRSPVSNTRQSTITLSDDPEVLALSERAHAALPEAPLLGVDTVRDAHTGKLYVIETNPIGMTWHFSSTRGQSVQADNRLDLESQFDGVRKAAHVLADFFTAKADSDDHAWPEGWARSHHDVPGADA